MLGGLENVWGGSFRQFEACYARDLTQALEEALRNQPLDIALSDVELAVLG
jgi:predicted RNase H-like HicB family nuclease